MQEHQHDRDQQQSEDEQDAAIAAARKAGITLVVPRPGQTIDLDGTLPPADEWW